MQITKQNIFMIETKIYTVKNDQKVVKISYFIPNSIWFYLFTPQTGNTAAAAAVICVNCHVVAPPQSKR